MHSSALAEQKVPVDENTYGSVPRTLGWLIVITAIAQIPIVIAALKILPLLPKVAWLLIAFTVPPALLLLTGGIGLIRRKMFGYYLIYIAVLFSGIGGLKVAIIPELKLLVNGGFYADDISLLANLLALAVLVYCHIRDLDRPSSARRAHLTAIIILFALGTLSVGGGRALLDKARGTVPSVQLLPYAGPAGFNTTGPVQYYSTYTKLQKGLTCVFSGTSTEEAVHALATENKLVPVPLDKRQKLLPQVKHWKLSPTAFPTTFAADDLCFTGRLKTHPRIIIQIGFRKSDQRFTAQLFGMLARDKK